jgi:menaquinone-specific isochorismate synthase
VTPILRARAARLQLAPEPPVGLLALAGERGFAWRSPARTLVTAGVVARIPVPPGPRRLERLAATVARLLGATAGDGRPLAVGALPFDAATPGELTVPALLLEQTRDGVVATSVAAGADPPEPAALAGRLLAPTPPVRWPASVRPAPLWEREGWNAAVRKIVAAIAAGHLDKAVLARQVLVTADRPLRRAALLGRLAARAAGAYLYASGGLVGASPELLIARSGRTARSRPLAGTVPRGASPAEEAAGLARLRSSPKEALEHRLVVDAVAGGLAKAADRVEVAATGVVSLPTVAHLGTEVTASLGDPPPSALDLVAALHPTPAVGGTPAQAALDLLARLEPAPRGRYAGPVGWIDGRGDGEWAVALRCAELDGPRARLFAGAGIVAGSDPDAEWDETTSKLRAVLDVLAG